LFPLVGQWSEIERKAEGEQVQEELRRRNDLNSRMPYTRQDQQEILNHLGRF
jgi:hypothetical protein